MTELPIAIDRSRRILEAAVKRFKPHAILAMVSGGNDSALAFHLSRELGVPMTCILHGWTRTGIRQTTEFVHEYYGNVGLPLLVADAEDAYEKYLERKGFFGRGETAHLHAYHVLKAGPFRKAISKHFRQRQRGRNILMLNGARGVAESARRGRTKTRVWNKDTTQPRNIWVNPVLHFTDAQKNEFLETRKVEINPVTKKICRSGECMCGTMQTAAERVEASAIFPEWGKWIDGVEAHVMKRFPWKWGENVPAWVTAQKMGQGDLFMPMCTGCQTQGGEA